MLVNQERLPHIRCAMHLNAVFASLPQLLDELPEARVQAEELQGVVVLSTRSGLHTALAIEDGHARRLDALPKRSDVRIHFLSDAHVNALFDCRGFTLPVLLRGWCSPGKLRSLRRLMGHLECVLKPDAEALASPAFELVHVHLSLGVMVRALCELIRRDAEASALMASGSQGLVAFGLLGEKRTAWLRLRGGEVTCGYGDLLEPPDAELRFTDAALARAVLADCVDVNARIGSGEIRVAGLLPLLDNLGALMQRIPRYLNV